MHTLLQPTRRHNRLPNFMQEIYNGNEWMNGSSEINQPKVNIIKTDTDYVIQMAAPGYAKQDFAIELNDDKLVLSAQEKANKDTKYERREFTLAGFKRVFSLSKHEINGCLYCISIRGSDNPIYE